MANINEQVYGTKENWYVPSQYSEFGISQPAEVYYYNQINADDKLKIKVANYNTLETPVTTMRSQMDGQYPSYEYSIRNNWIPTEFTMDNSIVQFGIGSQSGLANQEWWYVDREYGASDPSQNDPPVLKNTDSYEIVNMCLAVRSNYTPYEFYSVGRGSILGGYDNNFMYWQRISRQIFNTINSMFNSDYSSSWGYETGYMYTKLVTQIPIKNLKLTPVIYAYNTALNNYKKYTSIQNYLSEKSDYPNIFCIKAKFRYRSGFSNDTDYNYDFNCYPWFFNPSSFLNGYGYTFNNQDFVYGDVYYPNRGDKQTEDGITVAGRPGYGHGPNGSMLGNEIYWYGHYDNATVWNYTIGQGGRVLQTPDFKFELGTKNLFYCYVANMSNDDITEGIRKQLASFGLFFTDGENDLNLDLDDDKTFLGILENGVGYGRYSHGDDNRNQQQWNWDSMSENDYDPENPPTPVIPDNWSDDANNPYSRVKLYLVNNWYILSELWLKEVFEKMTGIDLVTTDKNLTYGLNPIDCIVQVKRIYCNYNDISDYINSQEVTDISFGRLSMNVADSPTNALVKVDEITPVTFEVVKSYPVGEPSSYRDFRTYMPFTTCAFYDAFCGIIELDPAKILNKYISIYQTVDALSGDKITSLYSSETPNNIGERVATLTGNCSEEIPINGLQAADYIRNKYLLSQQEDIALWNIISRSAMGAGGASISGISGNAIGAVSQAVGTIANSFIAGNQFGTIDYQLTHLTPQVSKVSKGTSNVESGVVFGPTLFLYLPKMNENYNELLYGNLTGFAGYKVVKPKDLSAGTHIFSHPKVSISGTKNEAYMLVDQLQKGIIIK